jgi:hypothetical protein
MVFFRVREKEREQEGEQPPPRTGRGQAFDFQYIFQKLEEKADGSKKIDTSFISKIRCTHD